MTKKEFEEKVAAKCPDKAEWQCMKTGYACRDLMCTKLAKKQNCLKK